jgi:archaellum biogenesis ATPase FlaH
VRRSLNVNRLSTAILKEYVDQIDLNDSAVLALDQFRMAVSLNEKKDIITGISDLHRVCSFAEIVILAMPTIQQRFVKTDLAARLFG